MQSFLEYKFLRSFRIPVEKADNIRFLVEKEVRDDLGKASFQYIEGAELLDMSLSGLGFITKDDLSIGSELRISLQFKKAYADVTAKVVRSFNDGIHAGSVVYGIQVDEDDQVVLKRFLDQFVLSLSPERMRESMSALAISKNNSSQSDPFEILSLMLSLVKDMTQFGTKDGFCDNLLGEVCRILSAQRATLYVIDPIHNQLEAKSTHGVEKQGLKFDYRKGIVGSVFTSGHLLNMEMTQENARFSEELDELTGLKTHSMLCIPIYNREDKTVGVLEVSNKRGVSRFNFEDEKTLKILGVVFSSIFHDFNPMVEGSHIRRFSTPFDRKNALIGKSHLTAEIRQSIVKMKDIDAPLLIEGEHGVGKKLLATIIHEEGKRGLQPMQTVFCGGRDETQLSAEIFGTEESAGALNACQGGTVFLHEISYLPVNIQERLLTFLKQKSEVRIISCSSRDLRALVEEQGFFNRELFEILSQAYVYMAPLRKRGKDDIRELTNYFLRMECKKQGLLLKMFSPQVQEQLADYEWPGNVRELKDAVEKAVIYNPKSHIISQIENFATPIIDKNRSTLKMFADIPFVSNHDIALKDRLALIERKLILAEIKRYNGNKSKTAKMMGISREALRKKLLQSDEILARLEGRELTEEEKLAA
ncbi:MAG: sigma 54-interacting transcriptional regulator [Bacteriovoracaceae bacterium]|nr:sigma 54-interacting transcriptional regulator [Bacteriovoracaceae bacterium]